MKTFWILVANASKARLFKAEKSARQLQLIQEFDHPESREKAIDLVTDVPGRYRNLSAPKSKYDEPKDPKQVEAERFAHELATTLDKGRTQNLYTNLVLIAPSHFQGLLNKFCSIHVRNLILVSLDKDYTHLKIHELPHFLDGKINFKWAA